MRIMRHPAGAGGVALVLDRNRTFRARISELSPPPGVPDDAMADFEAARSIIRDEGQR